MIWLTIAQMPQPTIFNVARSVCWNIVIVVLSKFNSCNRDTVGMTYYNETMIRLQCTKLFLSYSDLAVDPHLLVSTLKYTVGLCYFASNVRAQKEVLSRPLL